MFDLVEKNHDLLAKNQIFYNSNSQLEEILEFGVYCMMLLYGSARDIKCPKLKNDVKLIGEGFIQETSENSSAKLPRFIPTVDIVNEHTKRVYWQT